MYIECDAIDCQNPAWTGTAPVTLSHPPSGGGGGHIIVTSIPAYNKAQLNTEYIVVDTLAAGSAPNVLGVYVKNPDKTSTEQFLPTGGGSGDGAVYAIVATATGWDFTQNGNTIYTYVEPTTSTLTLSANANNAASLDSNGAIFVAKTASNQAGQVKVRFTGAVVTGFTNGASNTINLRSAAATVDAAPTTIWSREAITSQTNTYDLGFYVQGETANDDRLRENDVLGQPHRWRVAGNYTNKDTSNMGRLRCMLFNPDTGFKVSSNVIVPSGITDDDFTFEFTSIADNASLLEGAGYQLAFQTSFDDSNLTVNVNSILRISEAIDNGI